jgi:hypothetical protein
VITIAITESENVSNLFLVIKINIDKVYHFYPKRKCHDLNRGKSQAGGLSRDQDRYYLSCSALS